VSTLRVAGKGASRFQVPALVKRVYRSAGYGKCNGVDPSALEVVTDLDRGPLVSGEAQARAISDDQSIVVGYASSTPGTGGLPVEQALVRRLALALSSVACGVLGPDGKMLVEVRESPAGDAWVLERVTVSLMHAQEWDVLAAQRRVDAVLLAEVRAFASCVPGFVVPVALPLLFNPCGHFACGGPDGDNGLSGKKLVVDFYGPRVSIGGGAMSGKDFWKVDRAGPLIARDAAVEAVERFGCRSATVVLGISPGDRAFRLMRVDAENGLGLDRVALSRRLDLRLCSRADWWRGRDLVELARWGHFGVGGVAGGEVSVYSGSQAEIWEVWPPPECVST
jgi:S-adenosylmethionine synthetase